MAADRTTGGRAGGDALIPADENRRMFDAIVPRYDVLNRLTSLGLDRRWRRRTVALLAPHPGGRYLDIGCGTGDLGLALLRREPLAHVTGLDASAVMLERARVKLSAGGVSSSGGFDQGDACNLPYAEASFDGVMSAFCIRNITDRAAAFAEMRRVTRPGGTIVALELTRPAWALLRLGHGLYTRWWVPCVGRLLSSQSAYAYLNASVAAFPASSVILDEMKAAGMREPCACPLSGGMVTIFCGRAPHAHEGETHDA